MPLVFTGVKLALLELVVLVFGRLLGIKEAHERAVGHKRHDALGLVVEELEASNPYENNENGDTNQVNAETFQRGGEVQQPIHQCCYLLNHRLSLKK